MKYTAAYPLNNAKNPALCITIKKDTNETNLENSYMKKTTEPPKQETVVLPPNVVHVSQQQQSSLPPITEIAGAQDVNKQMVQANNEMNQRIEANKIPNNLGI